MRILLLTFFLMTGHQGLSQQAESSAKATVLKANKFSERVGNQLGLEKNKVNKLYHIDKKLADEWARVPSQFKDSLGRNLAYIRLEHERDKQYKEVLTKEEFNTYRQKKKELAQ